MILIDYSQLVIANLIEYEGVLEEDVARHLIINGIRKITSKFKNKYGPEVVLVCDSRHYWRKDIFPHYKWDRKKNRDSQGKDWVSIFKYMEMVKKELKVSFHHKVIEVEKCEADDIIAVLVRAAPYQKVLIISRDKDFKQLHIFPNVFQYSPITNSFIKSANPKKDLKEHIIRGDKGDGIPNILSPENTFVTGIRQKSIMNTKLEVWMTQEPEVAFDEETLNRYKMNKNLIDFRMIPKEIYGNILDIYKNKTVCNKSEFFNYMIQNRLKKLIVDIGDF